MSGYNFTDRVRKVLQMAREAAARLQHEYGGTELDVAVTGAKPGLSYPREFWQGLGIRRTNVEGFPRPSYIRSP
jgi:hypothetical protein